MRIRCFVYFFVNFVVFLFNENYLVMWFNRFIFIFDEGYFQLFIDDDGKNYVIWDIEIGKFICFFV